LEWHGGRGKNWLSLKTPALHRDVLFIEMPIPELVIAAAKTKLMEKKKSEN
jgi:hypothetical protein